MLLLLLYVVIVLDSLGLVDDNVWIGCRGMIYVTPSLKWATWRLSLLFIYLQQEILTIINILTFYSRSPVEEKDETHTLQSAPEIRDVFGDSDEEEPAEYTVQNKFE